MLISIMTFRKDFKGLRKSKVQKRNNMFKVYITFLCIKHVQFLLQFKIIAINIKKQRARQER